MKRIVTMFLVVMAVALSACGGQGESSLPEGVAAPGNAGAAEVGDIEVARRAYEALSEEDQRLFYAELTAEQEAREAEFLASLQTMLYGEWTKELSEPNGLQTVYAHKMVLHEDMTYEYGQQRGTWGFTEEGDQIYFRNEEDGVIYFLFSFLEEDGYVKLLSEEMSCYVRSEDYKAAMEKKYVIVRGFELEKLLGSLQYVGEIPSGVWDGPTGSCYIFDSLAYDQGLIFVGRSNLFEIEVTMEYEDGTAHVGRLYSPFDLQCLPEPYTATDITITKGGAYFVREEYVKDVVIRDGAREVQLTCGTTFGDFSVGMWQFLPEGIYDNFRY